MTAWVSSPPCQLLYPFVTSRWQKTQETRPKRSESNKRYFYPFNQISGLPAGKKKLSSSSRFRSRHGGRVIESATILGYARHAQSPSRANPASRARPCGPLMKLLCSFGAFQKTTGNDFWGGVTVPPPRLGDDGCSHFRHGR